MKSGIHIFGINYAELESDTFAVTPVASGIHPSEANCLELDTWVILQSVLQGNVPLGTRVAIIFCSQSLQN